MQILLSSLYEVQQKNRIFRTPRIRIYVEQPGVPQMMELKFSQGNRDQFYLQLNQAIENKAWIPPQTPIQTNQVRGYGLAGIKQSIKTSTTYHKQTIDTAFRDLSSLKQKTQDLVSIAEKLKRSDESKDGELAEVWNLLQSLGTTSGVTKSSAGKNFLQQLAREFNDFIIQHLELVGGILPLLDAFCLYNRARGSDPVSPQDLRNCCQYLNGMGVSYLELQDGLLAVKLERLSQEHLEDEILSIVRQKQPVNDRMIAEALSINVIIAKECLLIIERRSLLARDQTLEGLYFYSNLLPNA